MHEKVEQKTLFKKKSKHSILPNFSFFHQQPLVAGPESSVVWGAAAILIQRPLSVDAGIYNFVVVLTITPLMFTKEIMGFLNNHELLPADRTPSLTSIRGMTPTY